MILIVPSRGRPQRAVKMVHSARSTATAPVTIVVAVDADDPTLAQYRRKVRETQILPERIGYGPAINAIVAANPGHDVYGAFGDDVVFRTSGWDEKVRATLATPGIAFPNDMAHGPGWPTAVFMSGAIVEALGWLALPDCRHQYIDNAWKRLGDDLGILRYMPDVIAEHEHQAYGKAELDQTYREVYSQPQATLDHIAFLRWTLDGLPDAEQRVRAVL